MTTRCKKSVKRSSFTLLSKLKLRKSLRLKRKDIPPVYRSLAAYKTKTLLLAHPLFAQSTHVGLYLAAKSELDTSIILQAIFQAKKHCYLPILNEADNSLYFVPYAANDPLRCNRYGILEPEKVEKKIDTKILDFVLVPLVGFDCMGNRLGAGGGYYDRTFAFLNTKTRQKPLLIGLGFAVQEVKALPSDPWDIKLDGVLTENEFKLF